MIVMIAYRNGQNTLCLFLFDYKTIKVVPDLFGLSIESTDTVLVFHPVWVQVLRRTLFAPPSSFLAAHHFLPSIA